MAEEQRPLIGKVALISGASRGIGLAIALRAARDGANVAMAAKTVEPHRHLPGTIYSAAEEVEKAGGRALPLQMDVTKDEEIEAAFQRTVETFGRLDILMNNAAIQVPGSTRTVQPRHIDLIDPRLDLRAPIMCIRSAIEPMLRSGGGHIVNISSRAGIFPGGYSEDCILGARSRQPFYAMVKSGLERYSQALAMELSPMALPSTCSRRRVAS